MNNTAIVILNWNGIEYLKMFLGKVIYYSNIRDTIIYVADNGSTDDSCGWIQSNFSDVKLIRLDKNHGFAGGYNLSLKQIDAKYFVLLNSDIEVTSNWLQPLVSFMDNNPEVAACQPKILSYQNKDYFEHAGAAGGYIDKFGYPFCRGRLFHQIEKDKGQYDTGIDVFWASGACSIVRKDAWERCGGFDSDFFAHMEEIDLCWRFYKSGFRVSFIPESVVYHVGGGSLPYTSPFKTYLNFRNSLFLLYKNLPGNKLYSILFKRMVLDGVAACMFLLNGNFRHVNSVWRAHMKFYSSLAVLKKKRELVKKSSSTDGQAPILKKSIVFEFYVKGNRTYSGLKKEN